MFIVNLISFVQVKNYHSSKTSQAYSPASSSGSVVGEERCPWRWASVEEVMKSEVSALLYLVTLSLRYPRHSSEE